MKRMGFFLAFLSFLVLSGTDLYSSTPIKAYGVSVLQGMVESPTDWTDFKLKGARDTISGDWLSLTAEPVVLPKEGEISSREGVEIGFPFPFAGKEMRYFGISGDGMIYLSEDPSSLKPCYGYNILGNVLIRNVIQAMPAYSQYSSYYTIDVVSDETTQIAYHTDNDSLLTIRFKDVLILEKPSLASELAYRWSYDLILTSEGRIVLSPVSFEQVETGTPYCLVFALKGEDGDNIFAKTWTGESSLNKAFLPIDDYPGENHHLMFSMPDTCEVPVVVGEMAVNKLLPGSASVRFELEGDHDGILVFMADAENVEERPLDGVSYQKKSSSGTGKEDEIGGYPIALCGTGTSIDFSGLVAGNTYYVYVYPYNDMCAAGPIYQVDPLVFEVTAPEAAPEVDLISVGDDAITVAFSSLEDGEEVLVGLARRDYGATDNIIDIQGKSFELGDTIYYEPAPARPQVGKGEQCIQVVYQGKVSNGQLEIPGLKKGTPYYAYFWKKVADTKYSLQYSEIRAYTLSELPHEFNFGTDRVSGSLPAGWSADMSEEMNTQFVSNVPYNFKKSLSDPEITEVQKQLNLYAKFIRSNLGQATSCLANVISPVFKANHTRIDVKTDLAMVSESSMSSTLGQFSKGDTLWIQYKRVTDTEWITASTITSVKYDGNNLAEETVSLDVKKGDLVQVRYLIKAIPGSGFSGKSFIINKMYVEPGGLLCSYPQNLGIDETKTTHKAIALTWDDENNPASTVIYRYRRLDSDLWSDFKVSENNEELLVSPLQSHTDYVFELQSVCSSQDSSLVKEIQASTMYGLPYEQVFTDADVLPDDYRNFYAMLPQGGSVEIPDVSYSHGGFETGVESGEKDHTALGIQATQTDFWLTFPAISMEEKPAQARLTFKVKAYAKENGSMVQVPETSQSYVQVLVSDDASFNSSEVVDKIYFKDCQLEYGLYEWDLSDHSGFLYVALAMRNEKMDYETDQNIYLVLDSINVSYYGDIPCSPVEGIQQSHLTTEGITLSWTGYSLEYGIMYENANSGEKDTVYTRDTEITLVGLEPGTPYLYQIVAYCEEGHRSPSEPSEERFFTTRDTCAVPTDFKVVETSWQSVTLKGHSKASKLIHIWAADQESYPHINYYVPDWSSTSDTIEVSGLYEKLNLDYMVAIRSVCSAGDSSAWTETLSFKTDIPVCGSPENLRNEVDENMAELSWTPGTNNDSYVLMYRKQSDLFFDTVDVFMTEYVLDHLEKSTPYVWQVQGVCDEVWTSKPSTSSFTTKGAENESFGQLQGIQVANESGRISILNPSFIRIDRVEVLDVEGKMIYGSDFHVNVNILLPEFQSGSKLLLIRVFSGSDMETYKVISM